MLKDAQTNLKGNFEIIGKRDPELWDCGYFICYKDETDMYVEPILVATNGTNFSYKHDLKDITMGRVRALDERWNHLLGMDRHSFCTRRDSRAKRTQWLLQPHRIKFL